MELFLSLNRKTKKSKLSPGTKKKIIDLSSLNNTSTSTNRSTKTMSNQRNSLSFRSSRWKSNEKSFVNNSKMLSANTDLKFVKIKSKENINMSTSLDSEEEERIISSLQEGIKILPNARCGDFGTISLLGMYPKGCNIIISNHGCKKHGFKYYGLYQTLYINDFLKPKQIFSYGNVSKKEYKFINKKYKNNIIVFPEHRKKRQYKKSAYTIGTSINASFNNKTGKNCYCSFILQDKLIEIKPLSFDEKEAC